MVDYLYASSSPWTFQRSDGFSWNWDTHRYFCYDQHTTKFGVKGRQSNWKGRSKKHTSDISLFILNGSSNKVTKNITNKMNSHGWPIQTGDHSICAVCLGCICFRDSILRILELSTKITQTDEGFYLLSFLLFGVQSLVNDIIFISHSQSVTQESVIKMFWTQHFM